LQTQKRSKQPISRVKAWQIIKNAALALRKTFDYHQYKKGTSIAILMELFNHSSERMTLRYIGITQDDKDQAVISLDL
jgi:integrase